MSTTTSRAVAAAVAIAVGLGPTVATSQEMDILMALPAATLTFSAPFIAEDAGFYKKEGLKVSHRTIVGVGSVNAVIAGSADFTVGTGPVFLRAASQGQRLYAIANLIDKPLVELVLRKDVADAAGVGEGTPLAARAKALRGKTIGIQGVGSIVHAWQRLVANRGGLDIEKDVRIAPMDPSAMLAALQTKAVDGYATSLPFTTEAVVKGKRRDAGERGERRARSPPVRLWPRLHPSRHLHEAAGEMRARGARARGRQRLHRRSAREPRSISCASASTRWTQPCSPPPGRWCRPPMPGTCA